MKPKMGIAYVEKSEQGKVVLIPYEKLEAGHIYAYAFDVRFPDHGWYRTYIGTEGRQKEIETDTLTSGESQNAIKSAFERTEWELM